MHGPGLRLFEQVEQARLSDVGALPAAERLRDLFETLYDPNHPLRR
jgi:hypothetical protein